MIVACFIYTNETYNTSLGQSLPNIYFQICLVPGGGWGSRLAPESLGMWLTVAATTAYGFRDRN
jgi:hypothetical protein